MTPIKPLILGFPEYREQTEKLAAHAQLDYEEIKLHGFPDGESKVRLPSTLPSYIAICRSLDHPNQKLVELILAAQGARETGAHHITLIAPYLSYMRQDKAFHPGEVVSQQVIGQCLARYFDAVITVDAHLHRISHLHQAIPVKQAVNLTATDPMAQFLSQQFNNPFLLGPDCESEQWVADIASHYQLDYGVAEKQRFGDRDVSVQIPEADYAGRDVVMVDDVASTGKTLLTAARALSRRHPASLSVLVTHALFEEGALEQLRHAGISNIWSCDAIPHSTNAVPLAGILSQALLLICAK